jgi:hypothetical protein
VLQHSDELVKLDTAASETWEAICGSLGVDPYAGNLGRHVQSWRLYQDPIPRRKLLEALKRLSREQQAALLAVAWYGRGTNPNLIQGYSHALSLFGSDATSEILYVAMQIQYIEIGLAKLNAAKDK